MSQILELPGFLDANIVNQSQLSANVAAASSGLPVANANFFTTQYLLVGTKGSNIAEILPNTSVSSGTSITLGSNTVLAHSQYDPVYALFGNQIRIYRALDNGLDQYPGESAFNYGTPYATINIVASENITQYEDVSGGGNYWYNFTYYNSTTSTETLWNDATAFRGTFTVDYCSLYEIRREAGFKYAPYVTDDQIDEKRQAAQEMINSSLLEFYNIPLQPPIPYQLKEITVKLAAGLLRSAQYSAVSDPKTKGQDKIDWAEVEIAKLVLKERELLTKSGKSLAGIGGVGETGGWPDATTATAPPSSGGAPRLFRMSDIQGQPYTIDPSGNPVGNLYYGRKW